jgi:opacity protein-like surface antigen
VLAYGTGGAGFAHTNINIDNSVMGTHQFGWVAGAGLEYKVWEHWIARAEYLHYDFDNDLIGFREKVDVVRGGLSYKF